MFNRIMGNKSKSERILELENDLYKLNSVVRSLLEELGYVADYNFQWGDVDGVKKIKKEKEDE